ncbi:MAG: hypothetical protein KKE11_01565 [Gammaproteobacteria bacterium]|nr:hypothetical protein [Gammaproteobacteria bacterium]
MKKIISIALFAAAFGLVGCSTQDKPTMADRDYNVSTADHTPKCKTKKCRGKLGVERVKKDMTK